MLSTGFPNAVNFPFATDPGVSAIERELRAGRHGEVVRLEIRLAFSDWPRPWQQDAGRWLGRPEQGGFLREVFSHFAYLTTRLIGGLDLVDAVVERGEAGVETSVRGRLRAGSVSVRLIGDGASWRDLPRDEPVREALAGQLDGVAAMLGGRPHSLPTFADALQAQEIVEAILAWRAT